MISLEGLRAEMSAVGDPVKAVAQQRYMKSDMPFHGLSAPELRALLRPHLKAFAPADRAEWRRNVRQFWDGATHREEWYAAIAFARHRCARGWHDLDALELYRHLVVTGAWWDVVDEIAQHLVGAVLVADPPSATPVLRGWAADDDLWLRRTSVLCQLARGPDTDLDLLRLAVERNLDDPSFCSARRSAGPSANTRASTLSGSGGTSTHSATGSRGCLAAKPPGISDPIALASRCGSASTSRASGREACRRPIPRDDPVCQSGEMDRQHVELEAPGFDRQGTVIRYGHYGRPVVVFPSESGRAWDYENNGMVGAVSHLINEGRVKLYCVDSFDHASWSDRSLPIEERARRHQAYQSWITTQVAAYVGSDSQGAAHAVVTGCSMGAYHALQIALQRADLFPVAICQSGNYDPSTWHGWGERGDAAYFTNPTDYIPHLHGDHLEWLRSRLSVVLTVGEGAWETHPTGSLPSARQMDHLLADKGIPHELDVWGHDVSHDWPWWRKQIAHHLPRFC